METKLLARIGAVIFVAIAITMTAVEMSRPRSDSGQAGLAKPVEPTPVDPLLVELQRCQSIGEAGASDADCLRAWAENRRRFLSPGARPQARIAGASGRRD